MKVLSHTTFEASAILKHGEQMLLNILLPLAALVVLSRVPMPGRTESMPVEIAYASALGLAWASTAFTSQAISIAFDRRWGVLRMLSTTPLGPRGLFAGKLGAIGLVAIVEAIVMTIAAVLLGMSINLAVIPAGILLCLVGLAAFLALGMLVGGTLRPEAVLALANLGWVVMAGLGGLLLPLATYPSWWATIASFTPPGALGEALRNIDSGSTVLTSILVLGAWALLGSIAVSRTFTWDSK